MLHAVAAFGLRLRRGRFVLGIGESGNFPAGIKAVTEWFPKKERAFATGIFNAGTNVGAIVTPLIVPALTLAYGWRAAFVDHRRGQPRLAGRLAGDLPPPARVEARLRRRARLDRERSAPTPPAQIPWRTLLRCRETWAFALGKFLIDPIWWMFLFWLPDFLGQALRPRPQDASARRWSRSTSLSDVGSDRAAAGCRRG